MEEEGTKDNPGQLGILVSPSQLPDQPHFPSQPPGGAQQVGRTNRHHHTTVERQQSMRVHGEVS